MSRYEHSTKEQRRWDAWNYTRRLFYLLYDLKILSTHREDHVFTRGEFFDLLKRIDK